MPTFSQVTASAFTALCCAAGVRAAFGCPMRCHGFKLAAGLTSDHTPGNWIAEATDSHGNIETEADSTGNGRVHGGQDTVVARVLAGPRARANANLIATAPEMLRAIDWLVEQLHDPKGRQTMIYDSTLAPDSDEETVLQYLKRISGKAHEQL